MRHHARASAVGACALRLGQASCRHRTQPCRTPFPSGHCSAASLQDDVVAPAGRAAHPQPRDPAQQLRRAGCRPASARGSRGSPAAPRPSRRCGRRTGSGATGRPGSRRRRCCPRTGRRAGAGSGGRPRSTGRPRGCHRPVADAADRPGRQVGGTEAVGLGTGTPRSGTVLALPARRRRTPGRRYCRSSDRSPEVAVRRLFVVLGASALLALTGGPALAEEPFRLDEQVVDEAGVLGDEADRSTRRSTSCRPRTASSCSSSSSTPSTA